MNVCQISEYYTISDLRKKAVKSSDELYIGRVHDIVFDKDFNLYSFIIAGSRWEEFREAIGIIHDIDPIVNFENVTEINDEEIKTNLPKEKLKHKLEQGVMPENSLIYSHLKRKSVHDSKGKKLGHIVNVLIVPCGEMAFIIGGSWFEETREKLGFKENVDLLLPMHSIKKIAEDKIHLDIELEKLKITLDDKPLDYEAQREYLNSIQTQKDIKLRLLARPQVEQFVDYTRFK